MSGTSQRRSGPTRGTAAPTVSPQASTSSSTSTASSVSTPDQAFSSAPEGSEPNMSSADGEASCEVSSVDAWNAAVSGHDAPGAMAAWDRMTADERSAHGTGALPTIVTWDFLDAIGMIGVMGFDPWETYTTYGGPHLVRLAQIGDEALLDLLRRRRDAWKYFIPVLGDEDIITLMLALQLPARDMLDATGLFGGVISWRRFVLVLSRLPHDDRQLALLEVRAQGKWDELIAHVTPDLLPNLQQWLGEELGDGTNQSLQDRITAAVQSDRGRNALAAVDAVPDPDHRITPRLRELLALGAALPALEGNDLAREGILSPTQSRRAAEALAQMPVAEYTRLLLLLEATGDESRLQQQFLMLEAVAARHDQLITPAGSLSELEDYSDRTRDMNRDTLIEQTRPTGTSSGDVALQQRYTDSCGITSLQIVRANADPVEALRMHRDNDLTVNQTGAAEREQQAVLAGAMGGQGTVRRQDFDAVVAAVGQMQAGSGGLSATEQQAVLNYVNGRPFTAALYTSGYGKLAAAIGAACPGAAVWTQVRVYMTSKGGTGVGMLWTEVVATANQPGMVQDATGRAATQDTNGPMWTEYNTTDTNADGNAQEVNATTQATRRPTIIGFLDRAQTLVEAGNDVTFNVQWDGGGGHYMVFLDVRTDGGRQFQIHDPWVGQTYWMTDNQLVAGNFQGHASAGCVFGLMG